MPNEETNRQAKNLCRDNGLEDKSSGTTHMITSLVQRCHEPTHTLLPFSR